jgi:hypothetical protein
MVVCRVHVLHQMPAKWRHQTASRLAKKKTGCQKMGVHQVGFLLGAKKMLQIDASVNPQSEWTVEESGARPIPSRPNKMKA